VENISFSNDDSVNNQVKSLLNELGLSYLMLLNSKKLSGGEKRIISLLRGLLSDAKIVFIDELTNDLDFNAVYLAMSVVEAVKKFKCIIMPPVVKTYFSKIRLNSPFLISICLCCQ
jgi:ABC-type multidrug transport system ATPase subunit